MTVPFEQRVSRLHLEASGRITAPSISHAATLLVVHGVITILERAGAAPNINIRAGMGIVVDAGEPTPTAAPSFSSSKPLN
jgi:hypothetical protein